MYVEDKIFSIIVETEPQRCNYCNGLNHFAGKCRKRIADLQNNDENRVINTNRPPAGRENRNYANAVRLPSQSQHTENSASDTDSNAPPPGVEFQFPYQARKKFKRKIISPRKDALLNLFGSFNDDNVMEVTNHQLPNPTISNSRPGHSSQGEQSSQFSDGDSVCGSDAENTDGFEKWSSIQLHGPITNEQLQNFLASFKGQSKSKKVYESAFALVNCDRNNLKSMIGALRNEITPVSDPKLRRKLEHILKYWPNPPPTATPT